MNEIQTSITDRNENERKRRVQMRSENESTLKRAGNGWKKPAKIKSNRISNKKDKPKGQGIKEERVAHWDFWFRFFFFFFLFSFKEFDWINRVEKKTGWDVRP